MTLIYFILMLGTIVFIHELGHFIWAKKSGVYCYEFSLGFGPKLFSFNMFQIIAQNTIKCKCYVTFIFFKIFLKPLYLHWQNPPT